MIPFPFAIINIVTHCPGISLFIGNIAYKYILLALQNPPAPFYQGQNPSAWYCPRHNYTNSCSHAKQYSVHRAFSRPLSLWSWDQKNRLIGSTVMMHKLSMRSLVRYHSSSRMICHLKFCLQRVISVGKGIIILKSFLRQMS